MSCQRRLHSQLRSKMVLQLSKHNDIGILAEKRLDSSNVGKSYVRIYLSLIDSVKIDFNRIFGSHNVDAGFIEMQKGGINSCRLAALCRPRNNHHPLRTFDRFSEIEELLLIKA